VSNVELFRIVAPLNPVAVLAYEPRRPRGITLIAGHGYSSSKHNIDFLCSFLASHGYGVYSFDFPGHKLGASGGELRGVDDCVDAMSAVTAFARDRGDRDVYTMGHSMGGMTAIFTAALDAGVLGAIAIATGFGRPTSLEALQKIGASDFRASYVVGVALPELVAGVDARYARLLPRLAGRPCLYVAARRDGMVSPASVRELYDRAPEPKWFATVDSDHTYAAERSRATVLEWLNERHAPSGDQR
jgi:pimeloyl-ACP methyl ester carboxylesterase